MQSDRRIVFINQATGYLTIDIINAFTDSNRFKEVALIAGSVRTQDVPLSDRVYWSKVTLYNRGNPIRKFISWMVGTLQIGWLLLTKYRKYEVFYITIPPFANLLSLFLPNRFSILVYDVYPDALEVFQVTERNIIYRIWSMANRRLFSRAYRIYTLGDGMNKLLAKYNVTQRPIHVIQNWSGLRNLKLISSSENVFIREQNLEDKFIVQYSGNIGLTHNVEALINVAEKLRDQKDILFLIIGRGERYKNIQELINEKQLLNCRLLPFQPDSLLNYTLAAADLAVVVLDDKAAHVSIPSKIFNIQAVGIPILGISKTNSELFNHLSKYQNGITFSPSEVDKIAEFIIEYRSSKDLQSKWRVNSQKASQENSYLNAHRYLNIYLNE